MMYRGVVVVALLACSFPSCLSERAVMNSKWPPPDYYLEVRLARGVEHVRRARFWADGLMLLSESEGEVRAPGNDNRQLAVFSRICAYRLKPKSIRHLARLLEQSGLYSLEQGVDVGQSRGDPAAGEQVSIHWVVEQGEGQVFARGGSHGTVIRALHVINAFLPVKHAIELGGMAGEQEAPHLVGIPEPTSALGDALALHLSLVEQGRGGLDLIIDAFALAVKASDEAVKARLLQQLRAGGGVAARVADQLDDYLPE